MATEKELQHDRMRLEVARRIEHALGCPEGLTCYFDNQPDEDEVPGQYLQDFGMRFDRGYEHDQPYEFIADEIFGLEEEITVEEGLLRVCTNVQEMAVKFQNAALRIAGCGNDEPPDPDGQDAAALWGQDGQGDAEQERLHLSVDAE